MLAGSRCGKIELGTADDRGRGERRRPTELLHDACWGRSCTITDRPLSPLLQSFRNTKDEPAFAGSKHLQMFALTFVHERGELLKL